MSIYNINSGQKFLTESENKQLTQAVVLGFPFLLANAR